MDTSIKNLFKAISPPSMGDFEELIAEARKQARRAVMKRSDISAAVKQSRARR